MHWYAAALIKGWNDMYAKYLKRPLDVLLSLLALIVFSPLLLVLAVIGALAMKGNPFFLQPRPGRISRKTGRETIFRLIKFRTMSNKKDRDGNLLPDAARLNRYGRFLRSTSLDELPELLNILKGDMAIVGPRPQLVRDMVFMSAEQRRRHTVRPGLTGLAQVSGRNNITWEEKFAFDLQYIDRGVTLRGDIRIIFRTVGKVLRRRDTIRAGTASDIDFGDWLIKEGKIDHDAYVQKQNEAKELMKV